MAKYGVETNSSALFDLKHPFKQVTLGSLSVQKNEAGCFKMRCSSSP